jgi:hypothetical protein
MTRSQVAGTADEQAARRRLSSTLGRLSGAAGRAGRDAARRMEFGDALLLVYVAVFVRQYLWGVENAAAWVLTGLLAVPLWAFYVATVTDEERRGHDAGSDNEVGDADDGAGDEAKFWLVVAPPLLFIYALRAAFPDTSFDVWGLRLFHAERGLTGYLYLPGEFFPVGAPFNPAPDMVTGIFRHLLGYRLGTAVNLLALLWAGRVVWKLLRPYVSKAWTRAAAVLLCLLAEHLLFLVNGYMVDLLALPLLLEATRLALGPAARRAEPRTLIRIAFLVGAASALKLSNAAAAAPVVALCAWHAFAHRPFRFRQLSLTAAGTLAAFLAPLLPFSLYLYRLTASPVFPVYNSIFRSPFYPPLDTFDARWGGLGPTEVALWPLLTPFVPERLSELGVYSGRIALGTLVAAALLVFAPRRTGGRTRNLCFVFVAGALLWSQSSGYVRYGLHLEVLSGVLTIIAASLALRRARGVLSTDGVSAGERARSAGWIRARPACEWLRVVAAGLLLAVLLILSALACLYAARTEWGGRPTLFDEPRAYAREARYFLRDRRLATFLPPRERELFGRVGLWVVSGAKTAGLLALLDARGTPFVGARTSTYFAEAPSREWFARSLDGFSARPAYSLCLPADCPAAFTELYYTGLEAGRMTAAVLPFFSPEHGVSLYFYEVRRARAVGEREIERTRAAAPLPAGEPRAEIVAHEPPRSTTKGERLTLFFAARNTGTAAWPSLALAGERGGGRVVLRARWLEAVGRGAGAGEARAPLYHDLPPGREMPLPVELNAPAVPGDYLLEVSIVQESTEAGEAEGAAPLLLPVSVGR